MHAFVIKSDWWSCKIIHSVYYWEIKCTLQHITIMTHRKILTYEHVWHSKRSSTGLSLSNGCECLPLLSSSGFVWTVDLCSGFVSFGLYMDYASCSWPVIIVEKRDQVSANIFQCCYWQINKCITFSYHTNKG